VIQLQEVNVAYRSEGPSRRGNVFGSNLSFTVSKGECLGICGGNGTGKSTLMKLLAGLLPSFQGEITIDGMSLRQAEHSRKIRRKIGYLFQNPDNQIITTTVEDEIVFGLENYGYPVEEIDAKLNEALILADLSHKRKEDPTTLSDGEKQKLLFAAILAMDPDILLLDEPTSMLDLLSAKRFLKVLPTLRRREKNRPVRLASYGRANGVRSNRLLRQRGAVALPLTGGFFLFHRPGTGGDHPVDRVPDPSVLSGWGGSRRPDGHSGRGVSPV